MRRDREKWALEFEQMAAERRAEGSPSTADYFLECAAKLRDGRKFFQGVKLFSKGDVDASSSSKWGE